jgi:hypothetical protein
VDFVATFNGVSGDAMQFRIRDLQGGLTYRGKVEAVRQTYYVFEATGYFFAMSFSRSRDASGNRASGNFNIVGKEAVQYVRKAFAGKQGITSKAVVLRSRRTKHVPTVLVALNILYVIVALGAGKIDGQGSHNQLFFTVGRRISPAAFM